MAGWLQIKRICTNKYIEKNPKCLFGNSSPNPSSLVFLEFKPNHPFIQQSIHPSSCGMTVCWFHYPVTPLLYVETSFVSRREYYFPKKISLVTPEAISRPALRLSLRLHGGKTVLHCGLQSSFPWYRNTLLLKSEVAAPFSESPCLKYQGWPVRRMKVFPVVPVDLLLRRAVNGKRKEKPGIFGMPEKIDDRISSYMKSDGVFMSKSGLSLRCAFCMSRRSFAFMDERTGLSKSRKHLKTFLLPVMTYCKAYLCHNEWTWHLLRQVGWRRKNPVAIISFIILFSESLLISHPSIFIAVYWGNFEIGSVELVAKFKI